MIISRKFNKIDHPPLYFNQNLAKSSSTHKHLGIVLDTKLDFSLNLKNMQNKLNITLRLLRKLHDTLPRTSLIIIFKPFIRPHFNYGDIIYDRAYIVRTPPLPHPPLGWWGEKGLSHFSEGSYRRDLGQIGILGGKWHFSWGWFF